MNINCLIVPTGIGAKIGGFAGDANPVCRLLSNVSDYLITHPNVVNGAALTNIPENVLVLEGYLLDLFFQNKIALRPNLKHKIGVVVDVDISAKEKDIVTNCVNAAKSFYGLDVLDIVWTDEPVNCSIQSECPSILAGNALNFDACKIGNLDTMHEACSKAISDGATALAVMAKIPDPTHTSDSKNYVSGKGYDPIGLIEAKISHNVAKKFLIPCAHAPVLDPPIYEAILEDGVVHPKVSAEYIGFSFLPSVIQCLKHSPGVVLLENANTASDILISDLANLVVPYDACDGIPMHSAIDHDIELLTIRQNTTNLNATAQSLGLKHVLLENYLEAAGYLAANQKSKNYINPNLFIDQSSGDDKQCEILLKSEKPDKIMP